MVTISRAKTTLTFPANFMLIGAMNPCPCGYFGDPMKECSCSPAIVTRYPKRISGPLLDRIDIPVEVPRVEYEKLASESALERSESVRRRVEGARGRQRQRFEVSIVAYEQFVPPAAQRGSSSVCDQTNNDSKKPSNPSL